MSAESISTTYDPEYWEKRKILHSFVQGAYASLQRTTTTEDLKQCLSNWNNNVDTLCKQFHVVRATQPKPKWYVRKSFSMNCQICNHPIRTEIESNDSTIIICESPSCLDSAKNLQ